MAKLKATSVAGNLTVTGSIEGTNYTWSGASLDLRYVNTTGDTMTGELVLNGGVEVPNGQVLKWVGRNISSQITLADIDYTDILYNYNSASNFLDRPASSQGYGQVITLAGASPTIRLQLFSDIIHQGTSGGELYFRAKNDQGYQPWSKILTDLNFDAVTGGPYLPLTGGTLTGNLIIEGDSAYALTLRPASSGGSTYISFTSFDGVKDHARVYFYEPEERLIISNTFGATPRYLSFWPSGRFSNTNQYTPTNDVDYTQKKYVDDEVATKVDKSGDTMTGTLNMGSEVIQFGRLSELRFGRGWEG